MNERQLKQYGRVLVEQARELAARLGQNVPPLPQVGANELEIVANEVSYAHELLADIRLRVPSEVTEVAWERTKVEDGRTGEEIFERLGDVIHELSRLMKK